MVSQALKRPERLKAGLEEMIRQEEKSLSRDPRKQTEIWRTRIFEANEKRRRYQEMAAEGLIDFGELREKLFELDEQKELAEREIEALQGREQRLDQMRRDKDDLLDELVAMTPRLIDELPSEERVRIYETLGLRVTSGEDGTLEITGDLAGLSFGNTGPSYPSRS